MTGQTGRSGGARAGAGRPRVRITLEPEAARYLRAMLTTAPEPTTEDALVSGLIYSEAHARGWLRGNRHRAEFDTIDSEHDARD